MNETQYPQFTPEIINALPNWLQAPLPGIPAQLKMAPPNRQERMRPTAPYRKSAVLLLLYAKQGELRLLLTERLATLRHHAGEICFPGGGFEAQDADLWATALRETEEEVGISTQQVSHLGDLTPLYIGPSKNLVHPYVGWLDILPVLHPSHDEVAKILEIPLNAFFDHENLNTHHWTYQGKQHVAPCFLIQGACIWGATAMMLSELLAILREHYR